MQSNLKTLPSNLDMFIDIYEHNFRGLKLFLKQVFYKSRLILVKLFLN